MRTPRADGIAVFAGHWKLIDTDTLPDFLAFMDHHPDDARAVSVPISSRARPAIHTEQIRVIVSLRIRRLLGR